MTEQGWIGDPQPVVEWRDSHYSRMADRIAAEQAAKDKQQG
jgi:hypothetical protein